MKAKLTNGTIIELEKECDCTHHTIPHWLFMDNYWKGVLSERLKNVEFIKHSYVLEAVLHNIAEEQEHRLGEKFCNMKWLGIEELIYE